MKNKPLSCNKGGFCRSKVCACNHFKLSTGKLYVEPLDGFWGAIARATIVARSINE